MTTKTNNLEKLVELCAPLRGSAKNPSFAWTSRLPLWEFSDRLISAAPTSIHVVVAAPPAPRTRSRGQLRIIAVGRVRTPYTVISRVAKALAPSLESARAIPIIDPFLVQDFTNVEDERIVRRLFERSVLLYQLSYSR